MVHCVYKYPGGGDDVAFTNIEWKLQEAALANEICPKNVLFLEIPQINGIYSCLLQLLMPPITWINISSGLTCTHLMAWTIHSYTHTDTMRQHTSTLVAACLLSVKSRSPPPPPPEPQPQPLSLFLPWPVTPPFWSGHRIQSSRAFSSFSAVVIFAPFTIHHRSHFGPGPSHFPLEFQSQIWTLISFEQKLLRTLSFFLSTFFQFYPLFHKMKLQF